MNTNKITIPGIGSVLVDMEKGSLKPSSHVVGQRLCVGYSFGDARKSEIAKARRAQIIDAAYEQFGTPEYGWQWADHNGYLI